MDNHTGERVGWWGCDHLEPDSRLAHWYEIALLHSRMMEPLANVSNGSVTSDSCEWSWLWTFAARANFSSPLPPLSGVAPMDDLTDYFRGMRDDGFLATIQYHDNGDGSWTITYGLVQACFGYICF